MSALGQIDAAAAAMAELLPVPTAQCIFPAMALKNAKMIESMDAIVKKMHEASPYFPLMARALALYKPELAEQWINFCIVQDVTKDEITDASKSIRFLDRVGCALFLALYECGYSKAIVQAVRQLLFLLGEMIDEGCSYPATLDSIPAEEDGSFYTLPTLLTARMTAEQTDFFKQLASCLDTTTADVTILMDVLYTLDDYAAGAMLQFLYPARFRGATVNQIFDYIMLKVRRGRTIHSPLTRELIQLFFDTVVSSDVYDMDELVNKMIETRSESVGQKRIRPETTEQ